MSKLRVQSFAVSIDGYGAGKHLLNGIDTRALGYECDRYVQGERATHVFVRRRA